MIDDYTRQIIDDIKQEYIYVDDHENDHESASDVNDVKRDIAREVEEYRLKLLADHQKNLEELGWSIVENYIRAEA